MKKLLTLLLCFFALSAHGQVKISDLPQVSPALGTDLVPMSNTTRSTSGSYVLSVATISAYVLNSPTISGGAVVSAGAATTATPAVSVTQTWASTGATVAAIKVNVTSSGANVNSTLLDLQVGGTSYFNVNPNGGTGNVGTMLTVGNGNTTNTGLKIGYSQSGYGAIYPGNVTPTISNFALLVEASGSLTRLNSNSALGFSIANSSYAQMSTTGLYTAFNIALGATGNEWGGLFLTKTVTAGGTTGAQTINKPTGAVNFAAAATSLVVTNNTVTTSSIVLCTVGTVDTTMKSVVCVPTANTITITANAAATAETRVYFMVTN